MVFWRYLVAKLGLSVIFATVKVEWRLQVRNLTFWLAVLIAISFSLADTLTKDWIRSSTPLAQSLDLSNDRLTEIVIISLVFICAPIFFRDETSGTGDLLWTTTISVSQYVAGKFSAVLTLGLGLLLGVETITWVIVQIGLEIPVYAALPLHLIARLALLLPTLLFVVSVNLFLSVLVRRLRLFLFFGSVLWLGWVEFSLAPSMLQLGNFLPSGVFYSSILGLGPDKVLLIANRMLWAGIALVMLALTTRLYTWREHRARLHTHSMWKLGLISITGLGLLIKGWTTIDHVSDSLQADPLPARLLFVNSLSDDLTHHLTDQRSTLVANPSPPDWMSVQVLTVTANVSLTPDNGQIQGETTLTLHYEGKEALEEVPLLLNSELQVERVLESETEQEVSFTRVGLELILHPMPSLKPGTTWMVRILYGGHYKTSRVAYRDLDACLRKVVETHSYVGQGVALLMRDGDWYPWPLSLFTRREVTGHLVVQLLPERQTFHTAHIVKDDRLIWDGRWPALLVASYTPGKLHRLVVTGGHAYLADLGDIVAREEAFDYAAVYTGMSRWLEGKTASITLVQVPLILQPVATVGPSGEDVLFIPEGTAFVNRQRDGYTGARIRGDMEHLRRARAREVAAAWWAARLDFPSPHYIINCPIRNIDCTVNPNCTLQTIPSDLFLDLLSSVSAGAWLETIGQPVESAEEARLFDIVFGKNLPTLLIQADPSQQFAQKLVMSLEAEKELARRGALPASTIPYWMIGIVPDSLNLVEAWVKLGGEGLGKILHDWLDSQSERQADMYDLLERLGQ